MTAITKHSGKDKLFILGKEEGLLISIGDFKGTKTIIIDKDEISTLKEIIEFLKMWVDDIEITIGE